MKNKNALTVRDADTGRECHFNVTPGPIPGTTRLTFGSSFALTLDNVVAEAVSILLKQVAAR